MPAKRTPHIDYPARTIPLGVGGCIAVERGMDHVFPFASYREYQEKTLSDAITAVNDPTVDVVIIDAPTGVGKSGLNVALCRNADSAFYTTPQKKLREQLGNDKVLSNHYKTLKSRRDYVCGETGADCDDCSIYNDPKQSCASQDDCTYWNHKLVAMGAQTAVVTFAYLIVDTMLGEGGHAFDDRDLLVVDEAQSLENQVANLFAGFTVGPNALPACLFDGETRDLDMNASRHPDVDDIITRIYAGCETLVKMAERKECPFTFRGAQILEHDVDEVESFMSKIEWYWYETQDEGRDWVVETEKVHNGRGSKVKAFRLIPVNVDRFLQNFVWNRADTIVLSTATMPFRSDPGEWLKRIGLDPEEITGRVVTSPMPFPAENRPIHLDHAVCKMSGGGDADNWDAIMEKLDELAGKHPGQNGLIHSASYDRANRIKESAKQRKYQHLYRNVMVHDPSDDADETINEWLGSSENILISPSMMEGISLAGDTCRWQVLLKVPFPSTGDNRVDYLLEETPDVGWDWYNETAANQVVQSAGRAVRHPTDVADYYVLDTAFNTLRRKVSLPTWFNAAIGLEATATGQQDALDW